MSQRYLVPAWLQGVWRRNTLRVETGVADHTTQVYWVQTPTLFSDIRIPASRPHGAGRASLADYDDDELLRLAGQKGFAGSLRVDGQICRWQRRLDYQPDQLTPDEGAIFREGETLSETGIHGNYFEDYTLSDDGGGRFLALECSEHRQLLVLAGDCFLFARGRAENLPKDVTLADLVADAGLAEKRSLLDCEFSLGRGLAGDDPWQIDLSTLPHREGLLLFPASAWRFDLDRGQATETGGSDTRVWAVHSCTLDSNELSRLFRL